MFNFLPANLFILSSISTEDSYIYTLYIIIILKKNNFILLCNVLSKIIYISIILFCNVDSNVDSNVYITYYFNLIQLEIILYILTIYQIFYIDTIFEN